MAVNPILELKLTGSKIITEMDYTNTWVLQGKLEENYYISATDGAQTINITKIPNRSLLVINGDTALTVTITIGGVTTAFLTNLYVLSSTEAFFDTITSLTITSTSTTSENISVRLYGVQATV